MHRHRLLFVLLVMSVVACTKKETEITGTWRAVIEMQGQELPFTFDLQQTNGKYTAIIHNAEERLFLDEVDVKDDTLIMVLHIFDAQVRAKIKGDKLSGWFIKNYAPDATLPFTAAKGDTFRYVKAGKASVDFSGKYAVTFTTEKDTTQAV